MNLTKIILATVMALTFTTTVNADFKKNSCNIAERSFLDVVKAVYPQVDHSFVDALDDEGKRVYFNGHKGKLVRELATVRDRCTNMDKDVQSFYDKKISIINAELNKI